MKDIHFTEDIRQALNVLKNGGIILYPTDTVWGLGCDATNDDAVKKIFRIKKRADNKSLIILVNGFTMLSRYVSNIPDAAAAILEVSDTPVTIIYPEGKNLAAGVCDEDGSVGIRICRDDFCSELITRFRKPIVSTSANCTGIQSPSNFPEIDKEIVSSADYVVRHGQDDLSKKTPSSIIKVDDDGVVKIIRK